MSRSKDEQQLMAKDPSNRFRVLPSALGGIIASYLSVNDVLQVMRSSITTHRLFQPNLVAKKAKSCVARGDLDTLKLVAQRQPEALFQKGMIIDPRGRKFNDVSAYQLIHFLCDVDMKHHILPLIPPTFEAKRQEQIAELGQGGSDLIRLDRDPLVVAYEGFSGFTQLKQSFTLYNGTQQEVSFPLLENVDGVVYYQDEHKEVHFYYINRTTQTIVALEPQFKSEEDRNSLDAFKASFEGMEPNSSRRSSDAEHQLVHTLFHRLLQRQGIHYEHHNIRYRDSRTGFRLINAYRTSIRLYAEAEQNEQWGQANDYWCRGVGLMQGEEMWILQRICEENRPFHPLPAHFNEFKRGVTFYSWISCGPQAAVLGGNLVVGLGLDFALFKGLGGLPPARSSDHCASNLSAIDLVAVVRLVEDAKANIIEKSHESEQALQPTAVKQHHV